MYEFTLQDFLNNVLVSDSSNPPSIQTSVIIDGTTENEAACAACNFLTTVFDFLNSCNNTNYNYTDYYTINPDTGSGTDVIVMIESGIMDSPYLKNYVSANYIFDRQSVGG